MRKNFNVAVVGATGAVGIEMVTILEERNFPGGMGGNGGGNGGTLPMGGIGGRNRGTLPIFFGRNSGIGGHFPYFLGN